MSPLRSSSKKRSGPHRDLKDKTMIIMPRPPRNGFYHGQSVAKISVGDTVELMVNGDEDGMRVEVLETLQTHVRIKIPLEYALYWEQSLYNYNRVRKVECNKPSVTQNDDEPAWEDLPGCSPESSRWWEK